VILIPRERHGPGRLPRTPPRARCFYTEHGVPHFHADYAGQQASVEIETGHVRGTLAPTAQRLVLEWLALHRPELLENWQRARAQEPLQKIAPLD
jgi:hypothetical protein